MVSPQQVDATSPQAAASASGHLVFRKQFLGEQHDRECREREARELVEADAGAEQQQAGAMCVGKVSDGLFFAASKAGNSSETLRRVARVVPGIPIAAATAKLSRPSGITNAMSLAVTARSEGAHGSATPAVKRPPRR